LDYRLHHEALAINITFNVSKTVCMIFKPLNSRYAIIKCDIFQAFSASGKILTFVIQLNIAVTCVDDEDMKRKITALFKRCNILSSRFNPHLLKGGGGKITPIGHSFCCHFVTARS